MAGVFDVEDKLSSDNYNYKKSPNKQKEESVDSTSLLFDRKKTFNVDDKIDRA